ncbi:MAG: hypothetical protein ACK559_14155, partial [bacterium]
MVRRTRAARHPADPPPGRDVPGPPRRVRRRRGAGPVPLRASVTRTSRGVAAPAVARAPALVRGGPLG